MASSGLDEVFKISALIINVKDNEHGSTCLSCLVFSHYFIWTSITSSGAVIIADWLEVVTSSQITSS